MNQWFGADGHLQNVFTRILDLAILNVCFLVSCVPLVTIGAALTALYSVNLRVVRGEEGVVFQDYWKAFRANFRPATRLWLLWAALGAVFLLDFWALAQLEGMAVLALKALLGAMLLIYLAAWPYVFGYTARFEDTLAVTVKNALMICGANLLPTVSMLCVTFLAAFVSLYSLELFLRAVFIWVVLGFAALNLLKAFLLNRVFAKY